MVDGMAQLTMFCEPSAIKTVIQEIFSFNAGSIV